MKTTILNFTEMLAAQALLNGRHETAKCYKSAVRSLTVFAGSSLTFGELDAPLLKRFERSMLDRGLRRNTISLYMRLLRAIRNQAVRRGLAEPDADLFRHVFTGSNPTRKQSVPLAVIGTIRTAPLTDCPQSVRFARDLFMLSFYLRGIPFVDLSHLRKTDVRDGLLCYRRSKTGHLLCVRVEPCADEIIRRWTDETSPYLLPILPPATAVTDHRSYETALRTYNHNLSRLSAFLRLSVSLSSYVPRHSWATIAYTEGVSVAYISEALSHSSEAVTRHYLRSFSPDSLAGVNQFLIGLLDDHQHHTGQSFLQKHAAGATDIPGGHKF